MIHFLVGNTGSGKTTYAQNLKKEVLGIIFSIDEWNKTLFLQDKKENDGLDWFLERIERAEIMMQSLILQLEKAKTDAILDLGFSKFEHREKFRKFAEKHQIDFQLHFLDVPKKVRKERIVKRNTEKGATFQFDVSDADFEFMETWFEYPTTKELANAIIIKA